MKVRILAIVLALLMLSGALVSCTDDSTPDNETTKDVVESTAPVSESDTAVAETDHLAGVTFPDEKVNILYWNDASNAEFEIIQQTGVPIDNAIYTRDSKVQNQLGIEFVWNGQPGNKSHAASFKNYVSGNINDGLEIIAVHSMVMGNLAVEGLLLNLLDADYFDWEGPWWPTDLIGDATINDKLFFCSGDISNNTLLAMEGMFYNKDLARENYYDLVDANEWTLDRFINATENFYENADDDSEKSLGDKFGFATYNGMINALFVGSGIRFLGQDKDGKLILSETYVSEKTQNIISRFNNQFNNVNDWIYVPRTHKNALEETIPIFKEGRSLFYMASVRFTINNLSDASSLKYGILPVPKYNKDQKSFYTLSANTYSLYGVAKTCDGDTLNKCAAVIEQLAYESYKTVTPVVFEVTLKTRYADDVDDARMFDILRASTVMEIGLIFSDSLDKVPSTALSDMIDNKTSTWMSYMTGKNKALNFALTELNAAFN